MAEVGIGLGANLGDRCNAIAGALTALGATDGVEILAVSSVYATPPWGVVEQPEFLNACALLRTSFAPHVLLARCKAIEGALGRTPTVRWGPRAIDIDLLFYDDVMMATPDLTLPHPGLFERLFVLAPLAEIMAGRSVAGRALDDVVAQRATADSERVRLDVDATAQLQSAI